MTFLPSLPDTASLPDLFSLFPRRSAIILRLSEDILRGESVFSPAQRELFFAYGSAVNACNFCADSHVAVASAFGLDEALLSQLLVDIDAAEVDEPLKPVLKYIKKLTANPSRMTAADAQAIYAAGWDEQAFFDVVSICGLHNLLNRVVDGCGIDVSQEEAKTTAAELIPALGYGGWADTLQNNDE
ncbi:MAG: peroxidase [Gammaproteobacteria bacterium]|nr:peroxidase [Gammaproteobacteria bacterium]MBQ0840804.1 peroxidase [Gammaproteobacteria bacterium]